MPMKYSSFGANQELIDSFLSYLAYEKRSSKHTVISYKQDLQDFISFIDTLSFNECTDKSIRSWIVSLSEKDLNPRSINRKITAVRSLFLFLQKTGIIHHNPTQKIRALRTKKRLPCFIEQTSIHTLLDDVDFGEGFQGIRDKIVIELLYATGMRRAELLDLTMKFF
jgi:integrase/recombinase XerC